MQLDAQKIHTHMSGAIIKTFYWNFYQYCHKNRLSVMTTSDLSLETYF